MYIGCYDPDSTHLAVVLGGKIIEEEAASLFETLKQQNKEAHDRDKEALSFWLVLPDTERPNATWRAKLAELRKQRNVRLACVAIISDSIIVRGLLRTISWLAPAPSNLYIDAFPAFEAALIEVEKKVGRRLPECVGLYQSALAQLERRTRLSR